MQEEEVSERQPLPLGADTAGQVEESITDEKSIAKYTNEAQVD